MGLNEELFDAVNSTVENYNRVKQLIELGANVDTKSRNGRTVLNIACYHGHYNVCKLLLEKGAQPNLVIKGNDSPLTKAIKEDHLNIVRLLLANGANPNLRDSGLDNALKAALYSCADERIFTLLIEHETDVNVDWMGQTPLHWACEHGYKKLVELLLRNGANIHALDSDNQKPIDIAKNRNYIDIVNFLEKSYLVCLRLHHASEQGNFNECKILLEQEPVVYTDQYGPYCPFVAASVKGHSKIVQLFLEKEVKFNNKDNAKNPMYFATKNSYKEIVSLLMSNGANANIKVNGETLLHVATRNNDQDLVRLLLQNVENPNMKDKNGCTPLHYAAMKGYESIVSCLVENGANVNLVSTNLKTPLLSSGKDASNDAYTPLHYAAINGNEVIVKYLLKHGASVNFTTTKMETALHMACKKGLVPIVKILLEYGANIEVPFAGGTLLHYAALKGKVALVSCLIESGANVNAANNDMRTSLHLACEKGHEQIVEILVKNGANIEALHNGRSPLHYAVTNGNKAIVNYLVEQGANVNLATDELWTPLQIACDREHELIVKLLVERGADIEAIHDGHSALHYAVLNENETIVRFLIEHNANVNLATDELGTPLHLACEGGHVPIVQLLLKNGANTDALHDGHLPLHYATINGYNAIVNCLTEHSRNLNQTTNKMDTTLHSICENDHEPEHERILGDILNNKDNTKVTLDEIEKPIEILNRKWLNFISYRKMLLVVLMCFCVLISSLMMARNEHATNHDSLKDVSTESGNASRERDLQFGDTIIKFKPEQSESMSLTKVQSESISLTKAPDMFILEKPISDEMDKELKLKTEHPQNKDTVVSEPINIKRHVSSEYSHDSESDATCKSNNPLSNIAYSFNVIAPTNDIETLSNKIFQLSSLISELNNKLMYMKLLKIDLVVENDALNSLKRKLESVSLLNFLMEENNAQARVIFGDLSRDVNKRKLKKAQLVHEIKTIRNEIEQIKVQTGKRIDEIGTYVNAIEQYW